MVNGIVIGIIIGLILGWKACAWWNRSSIKKATDAVGSAAQKPGQIANGFMDRGKGLFDRLFGNKNDKEKS